MATRPATEPRTIPVTFSLPPEVAAEEIALCGEFNDWSSDDIKLARDGAGAWHAKVSLEPGSYRYRYLLDGQRWENAWDADHYVANPYGGDDSVVLVGD